MKTTYVNSVVNLLPVSQQIRNISVIAHVDHGKTTLVDSLLSKAGIIKAEDAGKKRVMDTKEEEIARGITIKSTGISLVFNQDNKEYLVNLVDSPGHVDFSSEVTAALRITDGALVVVDCVEGVCVQTEMVTRQALTERIRPVLHVNKVDRGIMELQLSPEDLYQRLNEVILNVNQVFSKFEDEALGEISVDPIKGTASFGSGKQGWAFTMPMIAKRISLTTGKPYETVLKRLWGDHFYDPSTRKFTTSQITPEGKTLERYACQMILRPLCQIFKAVRENDFGTLFDKMLPAIDVTLTAKEKELAGNDLLSRILQQWLPAGDALVGMIVDHLPSPIQAQKYRVDKLYTGPLDDPVATAIRNCDPNGPLTVFISKMVPSSDGNRFFAFGRVFSGTIRPKADVYIMNSDYLEKKTVSTKKVSRLVLMMGRSIENVDEVPCGNNVGISGLDSVLVKSGTISSIPDGFPIAPMKFSVSPVVRRALSLPNVANLSLFVKALKKLVNSDPCLQVITESSGECVIAGAGELHIEVALNDLREFLGPSIAFNVSPPVVKLSETVTSTSSVVCLGKSPNKLNRVYVTAEPMNEKLVQDLEDKKLPLDNQKELASILVKDYGWDKSDTLKLWWMEGSNCLVDCSHAVPYLHTVKDHLIGAVKLATSEGVLAGEPLRGVRFNIIDATLHSDNVHRGPGQLVQTARRAFLAAQLCAQPALVEPIFLSEIQCDQKVVSKIYSLISQKRGSVFDEEAKDGSMVLVRGHLPVLESFGFDSELREATSGQATPQLMFAHWSCLPGDPLVDGFSKNVLISVRERKKMKAQLPVLSDYNDKL